MSIPAKIFELKTLRYKENDTKIKKAFFCSKNNESQFPNRDPEETLHLKKSLESGYKNWNFHYCSMDCVHPE